MRYRITPRVQPSGSPSEFARRTSPGQYFSLIFNFIIADMQVYQINLSATESLITGHKTALELVI